jgi:hypothetical protein
MSKHNSLERGQKRKRSKSKMKKLILVALSLTLALFLLTACSSDPIVPIEPTPPPTPEVVATPEPTPTPDPEPQSDDDDINNDDDDDDPTLVLVNNYYPYLNREDPDNFFFYFKDRFVPWGMKYGEFIELFEDFESKNFANFGAWALETFTMTQPPFDISIHFFNPSDDPNLPREEWLIRGVQFMGSLREMDFSDFVLVEDIEINKTTRKEIFEIFGDGEIEYSDDTLNYDAIFYDGSSEERVAFYSFKFNRNTDVLIEVQYVWFLWNDIPLQER